MCVRERERDPGGAILVGSFIYGKYFVSEDTCLRGDVLQVPTE